MVRKRKTTPKPRQARRADLLAYLREPIVAGRLRAGDRLPPQAEVVKKFGSSSLTVKRAFQQLVKHGFARTVPKMGTFVADRPPHLSRYALVFEAGPDGGSLGFWSRFNQAVVEASAFVAARDGVSFATYYDVNAHSDSEGYQSLMRDLENQRLAGVIFPILPEKLDGTTLLEGNQPPRLNSAGGAVTRSLDDRQFIYRSIDALLADGRSRFAVITQAQDTPGYPDEFEAAVASRGAITHPFWTQAVDPRFTKWVRHAVKAVLSAESAGPPDGLIITDDHLVEPVAAALAEFGLRVPEEMRVIGHWNFPLTYRGRVPIDLLGFDSREYLRSCVAAIDGQQRGEKVPLLASVPARFSWELPHEEDQKHPAGDPAGVKPISTKSVL